MNHGQTPNSDLKISQEEFYNQVRQNTELTILDLRSEEVADEWPLEFEDANVVNYPYYNLLENITDELQTQLPNNDEIVVICSKGETSKMITEKLNELDYNAHYLIDGLNGWSDLYKKHKIPTESNELTIYQYVRPSSGCLSYLLNSKDESIVIDPLKQFTQQYVNDAEKHNSDIKYVIDTHIHADHISGLTDLSKKADSTRIIPTKSTERNVSFESKLVDDQDEIKFGSQTLKTVLTPGHTTGMTSFYTNNILFTGDSLFLNSLARPDLENSDELEGMAEEMYQTINKIATYDSDTIIAPGHKFSYSPNNDLNNTYTNHLENVKENIPEFNLSKEKFVNNITSDIPTQPSNYEKIVPINKGQKTVPEDEAYELEEGPNNCSASE